MWAIGGSLDRGVTPPLSSVERYCPTLDATRWSAAAPLPEGRRDFAGVGVISNKIYVAGGIDATVVATRSLYVYSAATGWSLSPDSLPLPMACGGGGAVVGGKLYVYAGDLDPGGGFATCATSSLTLMVYNPARSSPPRWTLLPSPLYSHCNYGLAALAGTIYVTGGGPCNFPAYPIAYPYAYNISTAQWMAAPTLPLTVAPAATSLSSRLLTFGGHNQDLPYNQADETSSYDPAASSVDALPLMGQTRNDAAVAAMGSTVVIVGGGNYWTGSATNTAEQLTLVTGCDIHEPDGTMATATLWRPPEDTDGGWIPGAKLSQAKICSASDVDNFTMFNLSSYMHLQMTPPAGKDYSLVTMDSTGAVLEKSALVGSVPETVSVPYGRFFVRVRSQNGTFSSTAPYRLELVPKPVAFAIPEQ